MSDNYLNKSNEELQEIFFEKVTSSLKKRLRSHASISFSVSGGVDSSILFGLSNRLDQNIQNNYTGIFSYFNQENNNDFTHVKEIQKNNNILFNHVEKRGITIQDIEKSIFYNESIDNVHLLNWFHYNYLKEQNIKVSIEGHGPDELLGGYNKHIELFKKKEKKNNLNIFFKLNNFFRKDIIHKSIYIYNIYKLIRKFLSIFSKKFKKNI